MRAEKEAVYPERIKNCKVPICARGKEYARPQPCGYCLRGTKMNEKTQKLTFGALLVAVFGVLLLLNRQTGGMLEETFIFLFPIPMVAFSAKYGWKDSLPVFVCTVLISIFCGIFTSAFYAITQSFIGMVYGCCLHAKRDTTRTMILVMALSVISNILSTFVLASLFGINMQEDIQLMQTSMQEAIEKFGGNLTPQQLQAFDLILRPDFLLRMFIISMIFMGIMQGFIVCQLSLLILRRLRYPIKKPAPITAWYPPRWTGVVAIILYLLGSRYMVMPQTTGREEMIRVVGQVGSLCAYMYLMVVGYIAVVLLLRAYGPSSRLLNVVLAILLFLILSQLFMFVGFSYIALGLHEKLNEKLAQRFAGEQARRQQM